MSNNIPKRVLNDGFIIPAIGFGTVGLRGAEGVKIIQSALSNGYRLLDTAYSYGNEATVGKAIQKSSVSRDDILVSSKLPEKFHAYKEAVETIQESLYRADLDYFDLYLIHWPDPEQNLYVEAWQALIDAKRWGLIRSIGVSNFHPDHLKRLKDETGVLPSVNQIETHPYFIQKELIKANDEWSIVTESWSPLGNKMAGDLLENERIKMIADKYNKTVGQVILRWQVQSNFLPIPKSTSRLRQRDNLAIFDFSLSDAEMNMIHSMSKPDGNIYG